MGNKDIERAAELAVGFFLQQFFRLQFMRLEQVLVGFFEAVLGNAEIAAACFFECLLDFGAAVAAAEMIAKATSSVFDIRNPPYLYRWVRVHLYLYYKEG